MVPRYPRRRSYSVNAEELLRQCGGVTLSVRRSYSVKCEGVTPSMRRSYSANAEELLRTHARTHAHCTHARTHAWSYSARTHRTALRTNIDSLEITSRSLRTNKHTSAFTPSIRYGHEVNQMQRRHKIINQTNK